MLTDGAVQQFSGREFQSLGAATEKRRAAVSKLVWLTGLTDGAKRFIIILTCFVVEIQNLDNKSKQSGLFCATLYK